LTPSEAPFSVVAQTFSERIAGRGYLLGRTKTRPSAAAATETLTLYYASDVHGSDLCWRKFLGAGRFYGVQALIMGGDLTGKAIVPVQVDESGAFTATFIGETRSGRTEEELAQLIEAIRFNGMYPWSAPASEIARLGADDAARAALFESTMLEELKRWIDLADERLAAYGIDVYVMPGNDDPWSCDAVIESAAHVRACDDRVVRVGPHEMISCGHSNPTPWRTPRELSEDALYRRIKALADQLEDPTTAIFNLHVPPYDSGLDTANEMNPDLTLKYVSGQPHPVPVGSHAVRQLIEEFQPLLALHGHIHESRGEVRIGRTLALNTGSEYNSGHIHGAVVALADSEVRKHQFVIG
jgi:Icc-related predicted phosphoesterase